MQLNNYSLKLYKIKNYFTKPLLKLFFIEHKAIKNYNVSLSSFLLFSNSTLKQFFNKIGYKKLNVIIQISLMSIGILRCESTDIRIYILYYVAVHCNSNILHPKLAHCRPRHRSPNKGRLCKAKSYKISYIMTILLG